MSQKIVAINSGSSSLKFQLFAMPEEELLVKCLFERIGSSEKITFSYDYQGAKEEYLIDGTTHADAVTFLMDFLLSMKIIATLSEIVAVGHRVAHGGEAFPSSSLITKKELAEIEKLSPLAPLHNPVNLMGIKAFQKVLPHCPQVAVFDTSFHQTMAAKNYIYPIPYKYYQEDGIRRYGFHGTSHAYVAQEAAKFLNQDWQNLKIITCHLGNGASLCGIKNGKSVITSMGFTPLAGLMMGTRCGDIDPSILPYLQKNKGLSSDDIERMINHESGLLGVSMISNDLRDVMKKEKPNPLGNPDLAVEIFTTKVKQTIGSYAAELGGLDLLVFTAGVGENSADIRQESCAGLEFLGLQLDAHKNNTNQILISSPTSKIPVMVIPTNEELMIVRDTFEILSA